MANSATPATPLSKTTSGDLYVTAGQDWAISGTLTFDSAGSIYMRQPIEIDSGANLVFVTGDGATGALVFQGGNAFFTDMTSSVTINGQGYTLVPDVATFASDIAASPSGFYALANNYDASTDNAGTAYATAPVTTTFDGTFEGLGNTISNLSISDAGGDSLGLFAHVGSTGVIRDIGLLNVDISGGSGGSDGAVAGVNEGTIFNSFANGSVTGASGAQTGGLVGNNLGGSIEQSFANDLVQAQSGSNLGGLVGQNSGTISQSYASGDVSGTSTNAVGGLVGLNQGAISAAYSTGAVAALGGSTANPIGELSSTTNGRRDRRILHNGAVSPGCLRHSAHSSVATAVRSVAQPPTITKRPPIRAWRPSAAGRAPRRAFRTDAVGIPDSDNFVDWTFGTPGSGADWVIVDNNGSLNNSGGVTGDLAVPHDGIFDRISTSISCS